MIIKNPSVQEMFKREWQFALAEMAKKTDRVPAAPGPGWLSTMAAKHNLCAMIWREDRDWAVCAAPLSRFPSENPYYCKGCNQKLQEFKAREEREKNRNQAKPMKKIIQKQLPVTEKDLPF